MDIKKNDDDCILFQKDDRDYVIFPIKHDTIWQMYKKQLALYWTFEEIDLGKDRQDYESLTQNEKFFINNVLAFFAGSDGIVMENLAQRFGNEIKIPEARYFYNFQIAMEGIHSETYALLIDTYITDKNEKNKLFKAIDTIPSVQKKALWAIKWIEDRDTTFELRLIAFAAVEGIFFSGSFCAIFWLKKRGLMPGLTFSNELISRDEGIHTDFAVLLYSMTNNKIKEHVVHELIKDAVNIETEFINDSIPCNLIGMNSDLMQQYIEFVADRLVQQLGYSKIYNSSNPFPWMELISLEGKGNFFEKRVGEYSKAGVGVDASQMNFSLDDDF